MPVSSTFVGFFLSSVYLSSCLSVDHFVYLHLSVCLFICLLVCLFLFVYLSRCLCDQHSSVVSFICMSVYHIICLCSCLFVFMYFIKI